MRYQAIPIAAALLAVQAERADGFCGFYVSGSNEPMFADATQVVLMRDGTRTVLSMQNDYKGPLADFAMVIPVPVVLKEKDVKTLPKTAFQHTDSLSSPRLVEYWEQDPCNNDRVFTATFYQADGLGVSFSGSSSLENTYQVKIEAKFEVAEYEILILSAKDSTGLERWLRASKYAIPAGAEPLLRPYVEAGSKFFVAKVNPKKVQMVDGRAALSPLRFHYDSEEFALPIRLGMANTSGTQDLIVNIISPDKRYEVANYKNVFIPTNFDVKKEVKTRFAEFYASLFDKTLEANPGAVVTEYAWTATGSAKCDPCPEPVMADQDIMLLGADVVGGKIAQGDFVLTRLHARYGKGDMTDDLRFKAAKPVTGGREHWNDKSALEIGAAASEQNFFQARYAIRHAWTGPIRCEKPVRGRWGGPPPEAFEKRTFESALGGGGSPGRAIAAKQTAFAPRGKLALASVIGRDLTEIGVSKASPPTPPTVTAPSTSRTMTVGIGFLAGLLVIGASLLAGRRSKN